MGTELVLAIAAASFSIGATAGMYVATVRQSKSYVEVDPRTLPDVEKKEDMDAYRKRYLSVRCNNERCGATVPAVGMICTECKIGSGREVYATVPAPGSYAEMLGGE